MKRLTCFVFITLLFVVADYAIAKADETIPEFDGGYIKTIKNQYIEMKSKAVRTYYRREADNPSLEKKPYVSDQKGIINIPCEEFKGILIKGQYSFKVFRLHTLLRVILWDNTTGYEPGKEFKVRSKSTGPDSYYFQPRNKLQAGKYVVWIGKTFWLFSVGPIHLPPPDHTMLKQYPLISQKDPKYYRDKSLLTTYDAVPGSTKKALVPDLACAATIYTILEHGLGNPDAVIDDFYVDPRKHDGSGPGAKRPDYVGADVAIDAATIEKSLKQGRPIILHGYGGPLAEHFVLAVGLKVANNGKRDLIAIDPYPGKDEVRPGRKVYIDLDAHAVKHPSLPIAFTEVRPVLFDIAQLQKAYAYRDRYAAVLYMANSIKTAFYKARALTEIAKEIASTGNNRKAEVVFSDAIETANLIKDAWSKGRALASIAKALASAGKIEKVIETANSIKDAVAKASALASIAEALANAGKIEKAIDTVNSINDARAKACGLAAIAKALASAGKIEKAIETANSINDARSKAWALAAIAESLASAGNNRKAEVVFSDAIETANLIKDARSKESALVAIAEALASAGNNGKAEVVFSDAIDTANSIKDARSKEPALAAIAKALANAGKIEKAIDTLNSIKDAFYKARALTAIAEALTSAGNNRKAEVVFSDAIDTANSIKVASGKPWALASLAAALASAGKIEKAIDTANSIKDAVAKASALASIAEALANAGKIEKAIDTVNSIEGSKDLALALLLGELAKLRIKDKQEDAKVANLIMTALNR